MTENQKDSMMQLEKSKALPSLSAFVNYGNKPFLIHLLFLEVTNNGLTHH